MAHLPQSLVPLVAHLSDLPSICYVGSVTTRRKRIIAIKHEACEMEGFFRYYPCLVCDEVQPSLWRTTLNHVVQGFSAEVLSAFSIVQRSNLRISGSNVRPHKWSAPMP